MESGAKKHINLRGTKLRKQLATTATICHLQPAEIKELAKLMGHDIDVHKKFYELPNDVTRVTKLSRLLMALEKGQIVTMGQILDDMIANTSDGN